MTATKARDVQFFPIDTDTWVLRSRTWDRLKFEIEYGLQKGTTANSYLIQADKIALFDPPGESFSEVFLTALQERVDPKKIDYVILGHVNPNRAATLKILRTLAPQSIFVCSNPGARSLQKLFPGEDLRIQAIKNDETLDLGQGHELEFRTIPLPRWPDGLATFDPQTEILFTDKFFGAHVCGDQVLDEGWNAHLEDRRYYFDCLMAPHVRQVESALEKLLTKPAKLYATGHGPLVRYGLRALTDAYQDWLIQQKQKSAKVALVYASAYGNTATLAQAIARGLTKAGVAVESINAEFAEPEQLKTAIAESSGVIFGSPTLGGHPPTQIQTAMGITLNQSENTKLAGVFGSFGWSGEAVDWLESKFKDAGFQLGFEPIRVKFSPTGAVLQTCEEAGTDFAQALKKIQRRRKPRGSGRSSSSDRTLQALGRIVGPLCIVTTRQDDISSGMLASWVSQATFNPPGFTVAVAKDRAIESLLHVGSTFVLNVLKEGNHLGLMKHFLKPFGPGEDRFQDIAWEPAENGSPVLADGLAHLECTVDKRMECGDHWLIYAIANQGQVKDTDGISVVHHRKTGSHY